MLRCTARQSVTLDSAGLCIPAFLHFLRVKCPKPQHQHRDPEHSQQLPNARPVSTLDPGVSVSVTARLRHLHLSGRLALLLCAPFFRVKNVENFHV